MDVFQGFSIHVEPKNKQQNGVYSLILSGPAALSVGGDADGVMLDESATSALPAGEYDYYLIFTSDAGSRQIVEQDRLTVRSAPGAVTDVRSFAECALSALEAVLTNQATFEQQSFSIAGRTLQSRSLSELVNLRTSLRNEVAREKATREGRPVIASSPIIFKN